MISIDTALGRITGGLVLLLALATPTMSRAQEAPAVEISSTRSFQLKSAVNEREYRLFVSLPEGYSDADTTRFPVLYVLDGNDMFPLATSAHRLLRIFDEVPDVIIVGIGYDARFFMDTFAPRWADYTPSPDQAADSSFAARFLADRPNVALHSGGGPEFLRVLSDEVIPFVEHRFRTTGDRGLWGHSLGGLFALYVLLEQPDLFQRYAVASPSLWWNQRDMIAREASYARAHRTLAARVFFSVADREGTELFESFVAAVSARGHERLELASHTFVGETHASVVPATFSRSFRFLYGRVPARE